MTNFATSRLRAALFCLLSAAGAAAPAYGQVDLRFGIEIGPPPPRVEVIPGVRTGFVWAPGYWAWNGQQYLWVEGRWVAARPGYYWVPDRWAEHWERGGPHWHYAPGRWEREHRRWERDPGHREHEEGRRGRR